MPDSPRWRRASAVFALVVPLAGCGDPGPVTLQVLAASSLAEVVAELGDAYRHSHPRVRVETETGGSQEMADRVSDLRPGDVLVTADEAAMNEVDDYLTGRRRIVAHNSLTIAVAPGNPRGLRGLADLTRPGLRVTIGANVVPVGRYARHVFAKAGLNVRWTGEAISARAVLDRVRSGQADAGLVYITDMRSAGVAADSVPIPADQNVTVNYPAAAVKDGEHREEAEAFVAWLASAEAGRLFHKHGFAAPTTSQ
ncbi:molybdate ABC transporter substrate-binding protein [Actinomadura kijaniata]|uniref:Molybdate transport system substrate-binding protein n=1 Tax=Actinomadura namibiensis TaxID=182080 RepID=A0A7W3QJM5_ACTNM|nr:molybdate ABC transporter substrate-binding protein [Actinomadura namibiensis]MBA8949604.1 molybdate transport system substrate-binding protein [Actinomadura namibiensis]